MTKAEMEEIADFIMDTFEGVWEVDPPTTMQLQLSELYRIIPLLMDETFKTKDKKLKTFLAYLELKARECKQQLEWRLAVKN